MNGQIFLYKDVSGYNYPDVLARTRKELLEKMGYKSASKMYINKEDGTIVHIGYVVGPYWMETYQRVERKA